MPLELVSKSALPEWDADDELRMKSFKKRMVEGRLYLVSAARLD